MIFNRNHSNRPQHRSSSLRDPARYPHFYNSIENPFVGLLLMSICRVPQKKAEGFARNRTTKPQDVSSSILKQKSIDIFQTHA